MIDIEIGIVEPDLRLRVPAEEDSVPVVRQALRSLGETVDAQVEALEDAELAVTEALANAVEHAYEDGEGDVDVRFSPRNSDLLVWISDSGVGMPAEVQSGGGERGFGLQMIAGIAAHMEIRGGDGTELEMSFPMGQSDLQTVDGATPGVEPAERILRRLVAVVAAQADMPTDRVVEALLIAELVARHSLRHLIGDRARIAIDRGDAAFELRVGPLEEGGGDAVVASSEVPVVGPVVERLADGVRVERDSDEDAEHLVVRIARRD